MVAVLYFVDIAKELLMCRFLGNRLLETINLKVFIFSICELQSIIKPTHQPPLAYHPHSKQRLNKKLLIIVT